jgi:protein SCO1/2
VSQRTAVPGPEPSSAPSLDGAFRLVLWMSLALVALLVGSLLRGAMAGTAEAPGPSPSADPATFLVAGARSAPPIALTAQDGSRFDETRLLGQTTLVFFGYTHCPDVCPATIGIISEAMGSDPGLRAVFVSVDPERDTVPYLADYVKYLRAGFTALTGTPQEVRATADAWGVRYAKVATDTPGEYSMAHTADVYVVDPSGTLRARFPFGTTAAQMLETLRLVRLTAAGATPVVPPATSAAPETAAPTASSGPDRLRIETVSSSIWAGGRSPLILTLWGPTDRIDDTTSTVTVQVTDRAGVPQGGSVTARAVRPPGESSVSYVAFVDVPTPGWWSIDVRLDGPNGTMRGEGSIAALDPGGTAALGAPAPTIHTPKLDDVGGDAALVTTDPLPELRLSRYSTTDALASGQPWVLIVDSVRFKVTQACGKAVGLGKFMVDRWPQLMFIHLEPYLYDIVTDSFVLRGSLSAPYLNDAAWAWGVGSDPWGAGSMPWVFVVDRHGIVRAKYQGVLGSDDVDVMLALLATEP